MILGTSLWRGCVTAFEVNHGDAIKPAFGYRMEYSGLMVLPLRNELVGMSPSGTSRHFAAPRNFVATGA